MPDVKLRKPSFCVQCWEQIPAGTVVNRDMYVGDMHKECLARLDARQKADMDRFNERKKRGELKFV